MNINQWLSSKTPQERIALIAGVTTPVLLLAYLLFWLPFAQEIDQQSHQLKDRQENLAWMQKAASEVMQLRGEGSTTTPANSNEALFTLIDRTAKKHRLRHAIKRLKPQGSDRVQIWIEQASFDGIIKWLGLLQARHVVSIISLNIDRQEKPGLVNARLDLERATQ
ncbi:type II secretion system protein M [bacterium endosymbiont of Escarpia laminata]|nr:MAG: type II secretion system protein M [bacterium endosymbiont of Escarpia laminata]